MALLKRIAPLVMVALASACAPSTPFSPPPPRCPSCAAFACGDADAGVGPVWGFADLHAHPAAGVAFAGQFLWGDRQDESVVDTLPGASMDAPDFDPCDGTTHQRSSSNQVERAARQLVFDHLAQVTSHPHGPSGAGRADRAAYEAWPHAMDVFHQQMSAPDIRRAYEGGLRLLFASVTDSQVIARALSGPEYPALFIPDVQTEIDSARRQLQSIRDLVATNASWMQIVDTPDDARRAIRSGRLAIVLSLEMDGLPYDEILRLIDEGHVHHVIPLHLVDNEYGGTAVYDSFFNADSQLMAPAFGDDRRYFSSVLDTRYSARLDRPPVLGTTVAVTFGLDDIEADAAVCQAPYVVPGLCCPHQCTTASACAGCSGVCRTDADWIVGGHRNQFGLTPCGRDLFRELMRRGALIDVAHQSEAATQDLLDLAAAWPGGYPVMASHGGLTPRPDVSRVWGDERDFDRGLAMRAEALGGVMGLGTEGRLQEASIFVARGAPLLDIARGTVGGVRFETSASSPCGDVAMPPAMVTRVRVESARACPDAMQVYAHLDVRSNVRASVETVLHATSTNGCGATICFGACDASCDTCAPSTVEVPAATELGAITLAARDTAHCWGGSTGSWRAATADGGVSVWMNDARVACATASATYFARVRDDGSSSIARVESGADAGRLDGGHPSWVVHPAGAGDLRALPGARDHLRVTVASAGADADHNTLVGGSTLSSGAVVCGRIVVREGGLCPAPAAMAIDGARCPAGTFPVNALATWTHGLHFQRFVRIPTGASYEDVCGLDLGWTSHDADAIATWSVADIQIESVADPADAWIEDYLDVQSVMGGPGRVAIGTDFNGFAPRFPFADEPIDADATRTYASAGCVITLGTMRRGGVPMHLAERGVATYGMLPDFLAHLATRPRGQDVIDGLMQSAEGLLVEWEQSIAASARCATASCPDRVPTMPASCGSGLVP